MIASIVMLLVGLFALSLSMNKHFKSFFHRSADRLERRLLKSIGWVLITMSVIILMVTSALPQLALVWWIGYLSLGIFSTALAYTFR